MRDRERSDEIQRRLDELFARYHRRDLVHPDPLEFVHRYERSADREIVGLIASSLAYGRVAQILTSVSTVLKRMPSPAAFVRHGSHRVLRRTFSGFKHRFTTGEELCNLLLGVKRVTEKHGSLKACFMSGLGDEDETVIPALGSFTSALTENSGATCSSLIPLPARGSACKRLNLFLRWMVRRDEVDPGGWEEVGARRLIVPLDTHQYRICCALGFTRRRTADLRTALEVTEAFRRICPEDPVRYDFALTRPGIWGGQATAGKGVRF